MEIAFLVLIAILIPFLSFYVFLIFKQFKNSKYFFYRKNRNINSITLMLVVVFLAFSLILVLDIIKKNSFQELYLILNIIFIYFILLELIFIFAIRIYYKNKLNKNAHDINNFEKENFKKYLNFYKDIDISRIKNKENIDNHYEQIIYFIRKEKITKHIFLKEAITFNNM
jgi:magnesium-transporting ATPase (P-type)